MKDLLGRLEMKSRTLYTMHGLLRHWSSSFRHPTSSSPSTITSTGGARVVRAQQQHALLSLRWQLKDTLGVQPAGGTGGSAAKWRGLVHLFPPSPSAATGSAGLSSTRPLEWAGEGRQWGAWSSRGSKLSSALHLGRRPDSAQKKDSTRAGEGTKSFSAITTGGLPRAESEHAHSQANSEPESKSEPFSGKHTPLPPTLTGGKSGGDSNVTVVGSLSRVVPGTRGSEVVVVLAVQNRR